MLYNKTRGITLTENVFFADSFLKRAVGLMFKKGFEGALIFKNVGRAVFHSFFCFFPILLVCLEGKKVKEIKKLEPWGAESVDADVVIELDARRDWDIKIGDELVWDETGGG